MSSLFGKIADPYKGLLRSYGMYWRHYGGVSALFFSPYCHLAIVITAVCAPAWLATGGGKTWSDAATNILPNLIGFSIAGMAIFLALTNKRTLGAMTEDGTKDSYFIITVASFLHFVLIQTVALLLGFVGSYFEHPALTAIGVFLLTYAVLGVPAIAVQLLHTARIVNAAESMKDEDEGN